MLIIFTNVFAQIDSVLVCKAEFKNSKFDNAHAGSGFLLRYKSKIYAITAKHVLFFARTDRMKAISFGNELKAWTFYSKENESKVTVGKLINENTNEAITMPPKRDWLIFEVNSIIPKNIAVYTLRDSPLKKGEHLYFLGCPYKKEKPISVEGTFVNYPKEGSLSLNVPKGNYGGCSGGPVLDTHGKLVGIVSMGYFNQKEQKYVFEPASLSYFKNVIKNYSNRYNKTEFYTKLAGIISPNMKYKGRGRISKEESVTLKHYRFTYNNKGDLLNIKYFNKNKPSDDSYYGTHMVKYVHFKDRLIRTYLDAKGKKAIAYRHYYLGNKIHKEVFQLDKNKNKTSLILKDSLDNQVESGMGSYMFKFQRVDKKSFIQKQFKKDGTPNILTTYFPFFNAKISINKDGFLQSIVNMDDDGNPVLNFNAGYSTVIFNFNKYGNELGWSFHDVSNNFVNRKNYLNMDYGFAKVVYNFDWKNNKLGLHNGFKESYYDLNNKPTENNKGIHTISYRYNKDGNFSKMIKYNLQGKEIE
ncbi:S1 family peptidase [Tenacibaculum crassostreae]|uniref:S1 family peptidase n=1 Tax=Tenacibaculum crassostreae TaxID=502683 RepID=UPI0038B58064